MNNNYWGECGNRVKVVADGNIIMWVRRDKTNLYNTDFCRLFILNRQNRFIPSLHKQNKIITLIEFELIYYYSMVFKKSVC